MVDLLLQSSDSLLGNLPSIANHLAPGLAYLLQLALGTDGWIGAVTRSELADSRSGEAALAVIGICAGTRGENCSFDICYIGKRAEED